MARDRIAVSATATIRPTTGRWLAPDRAGLGHWFERGARRSACDGVEAFDERHAWPTTVRCQDCLIVVGAEQLRTAR